MARIDFYDGTSGFAHPATVSATPQGLTIQANQATYSVTATQVKPTLSTPNGRRFFELPNGMALEFHDNADAEHLLDVLDAKHLKKMRWFDRHYRSWPFLLGSLVVFVGLIAGIYKFALPAASETIAYQLPPTVLDATSEEALEQLDDSGLIEPSKLSAERQKQLTDRFNALQKPDTHVRFKLHFYSAEVIGPNAFALPSGDVVLLDELVNLTTNDDQIMGVLAHELGHVAHRHSLRNMVQSSLVSFAVAAWMGDYGSTLVNLGASTLLSQKYSRDFERDADDYAIKMMKLNHISPAQLADLFVLLEKEDATDNKLHNKDAQTEDGVHLTDLVKSHPPTPERIETLRKATSTP